jgi:putative transposase
MIDNYKHKKASVSLINYHFVWTPKRRRKVLVGDVESRLKDLMQGNSS